jgi:hypothetical protein
MKKIKSETFGEYKANYEKERQVTSALFGDNQYKEYKEHVMRMTALLLYLWRERDPISEADTLRKAEWHLEEAKKIRDAAFKAY